MGKFINREAMLVSGYKFLLVDSRVETQSCHSLTLSLSKSTSLLSLSFLIRRKGIKSLPSS